MKSLAWRSRETGRNFGRKLEPMTKSKRPASRAGASAAPRSPPRLSHIHRLFDGGKRGEGSIMKTLLTRTATGLAAAALALAGALTLAPRPAQATPDFAKQTGLPCTQCHVSPSAPKNLTAFGKTFEDNGNQLPGGKRKRQRGPSGSGG
jgi:hypothetical protein